MEKIRVLLIEDNRLLREGIAAMLEREPDFEIIARSEDGDARQKLKSKNKNPDIVLLDLGLRKQNSLLLMESINSDCRETKIINLFFIGLCVRFF